MIENLFDEISNQKSILNQKSVPSSQYQDNIKSLNTSLNVKNEGVKHGGYQRFLDRKKGSVISNQGKIERYPNNGNKRKSISMTSYIINKCSIDFCK